MPQTLATSIQNSPSALKKLCTQVSLFLGEQNVSNPLAKKTELIVEELLTNIVNHAYPQKKEDNICISLSVYPQKIIFSVKDQGTPFNPCTHPSPTLNIPIEERPIGGMGIHLVKQNAKTISYKRMNNKNELTVEVCE